MSGIIIRNTLRTSWKQVLYWGIGLGILGVYIVFIASNSDIIQGYADLFEAMPPALLQAFGASNLDLFRSTEGWVVSILVTELALFLSVYAAMAGLNVAANEEQSGVMDVVLSLPISRNMFLLEKWLAYAILSLGIVLASALMPMLTAIGMGIDADIGIIFGGILNVYPGVLIVTTVTMLLTVIFRRRVAAIAGVAVFVIGSYVFNIVGNAASGAIADLMLELSYFTHVGGEAIVSGAYEATGTLGLLAASIIGFALSARLFSQRDIGL